MADEKEKDIVSKNQNGGEQSTDPHVSVVKKTIPQKIAAFLVSKDYKAIFGDAYRNILSPEIKKMALSAINAIARDFIYRGSGVDAPPPGSTDYGAYFGGGYSGSEARRYRIAKEITFDSREKAEEVLHDMRNLLSKKGFLTVADYYILSGVSPQGPEYNFGWLKIDAASIYSFTKNGVRVFAFKLPEPMQIDKRN